MNKLNYHTRMRIQSIGIGIVLGIIGTATVYEQFLYKSPPQTQSGNPSSVRQGKQRIERFLDPELSSPISEEQPKKVEETVQKEPKHPGWLNIPVEAEK